MEHGNSKKSNPLIGMQENQRLQEQILRIVLRAIYILRRKEVRYTSVTRFNTELGLWRVVAGQGETKNIRVILSLARKYACFVCITSAFHC